MDTREEIVPVLLGADLNCYNMARAFHEAYGVVSYAFGRYEISATKYSKIVRFTTVPDLDDEPVMLRVLTEFAQAHTGKRLYLFGCTDDYAAMIIRRRGELSQYIAPAPSVALYESLQKKAAFYEVCDRYHIPYPDTVVLEEIPTDEQVTEAALGFPYPIIVKPSSSVEYWKYPFEGMKKVYTAENPAQTVKIIRQIYASGYRTKMILQRRIPGGDSEMRVLTAFSDEKGKVRAMCLGHTMIEEHTPKGLGNHAAIVTEPVSNLTISENIKNMLEAVGYTGFSNFDIKHAGGEDYRVFEINPPPGTKQLLCHRQRHEYRPSCSGKMAGWRSGLSDAGGIQLLASCARGCRLSIYRGQGTGGTCKRTETGRKVYLFFEICL